MQIELEKEEYKKLLEMAFVGHWIMQESLMDEARDEEYGALVQKLFSRHADAGLSDVVESGAEGDFYPKEDWEEEMITMIEDYNDSQFWDELAYQLADRDFRKECAEKGVEKVDREARFDRILELEDQYGDEFSENGVEHLIISK